MIDVRVRNHLFIAAVCAPLVVPAVSLAQAAEPWWPMKGTVMLSGGGLETSTADSLVDRLIAFAGGPDALIVVIPSAHDGLPARLPVAAEEPAHIRNIRQHLASRGARNVVFLHTRDRQVANSEQFVAALRSAKAVFLPGGAFGVLDRTYQGTLVEKELQALLARGGVLLGDSAGAIALGCFSLKWNATLNALTKATDGLCVLKRVIVTPHVQNIEGDEQTVDVGRYVTTHAGSVGINLAENTVLVLRGGTAQVVGRGGVTILDPVIDAGKPYVRLSGGQHSDLMVRRELHPDSLFPRLVGSWVLRGTIARQQTVHDVTFEWLLDRTYVQMHEVSRERTPTGAPAYEAVVLFGRDPKTGAYACLWMDNTAAAAFPLEGTGRGSVAGDSISFLFPYSATTSFHTTFLYDHAKDSWQWHMDNDSAGVRRPFARVTLARR